MQRIREWLLTPLILAAVLAALVVVCVVEAWSGESLTAGDDE